MYRALLRKLTGYIYSWIIYILRGTVGYTIVKLLCGGSWPYHVRRLPVGLLPWEKILADRTVGYVCNGRPSVADGRLPTVNRRI
jgi:hypothetical protein